MKKLIGFILLAGIGNYAYQLYLKQQQEEQLALLKQQEEQAKRDQQMLDIFNNMNLDLDLSVN